MTQQHPISPPPELVDSIWNQFKTGPTRNLLTSEAFREAITKAAQWGADQELEALLTWLRVHHFDILASDLLAARRPRQMSLKEQALEALTSAPGPDYPSVMTVLNADQHALIRRALEQLND